MVDTQVWICMNIWMLLFAQGVEVRSQGRCNDFHTCSRWVHNRDINYEYVSEKAFMELGIPFLGTVDISDGCPQSSQKPHGKNGSIFLYILELKDIKKLVLRMRARNTEFVSKTNVGW